MTLAVDLLLATSGAAALWLARTRVVRRPAPGATTERVAAPGFVAAAWGGLAAALVPLRGRLDDDTLVSEVDEVLRQMAPTLRVATRALLVAFELSSILRYGARFSRLPAARADRWLRWWEQGPIALGLGLRLLAAVVKPIALSTAEVQRGFGYDAKRLQVATADVPRAPRPTRRVHASDRTQPDLRAQVVVIGTGAGGAVVAAELAERGVDVVMLEDGESFPTETLGRDPTRNLRRMYRDGGTTFAYGKPVIPVPMGRTVGGTTTVNSGTCLRVADAVVDRWGELGLEIEGASLHELYARVERRISVQRVPPELLGGSSHVVARGADALGLEHGPLPRNIRGCNRSAVCPLGCPRGAKQSTNVSYVPAALAAGARLYSGVRATRILVEGGRAVGVQARPRDGGPTFTVRADVVVSACGSVPGVALLRTALRSGHLGRHLTIHPATKVLAVMPEAVDPWLDTPQGYAITSDAAEGILYEGVYLTPEYSSLAVPFGGQRFADMMRRYRDVASFGLMVADEPNGRVRVGPGGRPWMQYRLGARDRGRIFRGIERLSEVFFAAGAERVVLPIAGADPVATLDEVRRTLAGGVSAWRLDLAAFHPLGTARMAADPRAGVIDPHLQSWEVPGLYVVDGSIFPSSLGVNPQLTIMAFATRAAETIARRLGAG